MIVMNLVILLLVTAIPAGQARVSSPRVESSTDYGPPHRNLDRVGKFHLSRKIRLPVNRQEEVCSMQAEAFYACGPQDENGNLCGSCLTANLPENITNACEIVDETCSALETCDECSGCETLLLDYFDCVDVYLGYTCDLSCNGTTPTNACSAEAATMEQCLSDGYLDAEACTSCFGVALVSTGLCQATCNTTTTCGECADATLAHINCLLSDPYGDVTCFGL